jgi:trehalose 6-phosphate phosphatase
VRDDPAGAGFVLDFDGTLASIVDDPALAAPVAEATAMLQKLKDRYGLVALVSGRRAEDVRRMVGVEGIIYIGVYGAEQVGAPEPEEANQWREGASRLAKDAQTLIETKGLDGCEVEFKDLAVSIHFRKAKHPRAKATLAAWAQSAASPHGFVASEGRKVIELKPQGVSKGAALETLVRKTTIHRIVTAGDDHSDIEMLKQAREMFGDAALRIAINSEETPPELIAQADKVFASPQQFVQFLKNNFQ